MPDMKTVATTAIIAAVVVGLYHAGTLNVIPVFAGAKK